MPRERANERACDAAIKKTLAYRAAFRYPLSYYQIWNTLISTRKFKKDFFDKELDKMVKKGHIGFREGKYFDKRIKPVSWETRYKYSQENFEKVKRIANILKKISWIKLMCVTGSVAAYNSDKDSDIDIFIVTATHRMWLTRGFVAAILKTLGVYQKGSGPGKICPNLYIDEEGMEWPKNERSIFTAHEIVLMQPVIDRDHSYFRFLKANSWVSEHFINFVVETDGPKKKRDEIAGSRLVNLLEKIAKFLQLKYMQKERTNEVTGKHMLHFRKNDNASWILDSYRKMSGKK